MRAFAIRCHGRRWLGLTPEPAAGMQIAMRYGWRPFRFVSDLIDAEKFGSRTAAELFLRGLAKTGDFSIVEVTGGGRLAA